MAGAAPCVCHFASETWGVVVPQDQNHALSPITYLIQTLVRNPKALQDTTTTIVGPLSWRTILSLGVNKGVHETPQFVVQDRITGIFQDSPALSKIPSTERSASYKRQMAIQGQTSGRSAPESLALERHSIGHSVRAICSLTNADSIIRHQFMFSSIEVTIVTLL